MKITVMEVPSNRVITELRTEDAALLVESLSEETKIMVYMEGGYGCKEDCGK
jgi:23S rRNA A2030 N6-methylase RlmJ